MKLELDIEHPLGGMTLAVNEHIEARTLGIFGASGAGKTTLLHLIAGLRRARQARIVLDGEILCDSKRGLWLAPEKRSVAVVFQDARLFPHMSVRDNLLYGRRRMRGRTGRFDFDTVLALLEIAPLLQRRTHALSGGEAQRVSLGRALLAEPRLLLLDEPMSALDRRLRTQIMPFLERIRDQLHIPMVMVSHDLDELIRLSHHLLLLERGVCTACGELEELARQAAPLETLMEAGMRNHVEVLPDRVMAQASCQEALFACERADASRVRVDLPNWDLPTSRPARLAVRPDDIIIARDRVSGISVRNQFPATVRECIPRGGNLLVELDAGARLWAEITRDSAEALGVIPGADVMCFIKTNSWRRVG